MISAWEKSVDLLSRAEHSSQDLVRKLRSRGYDPEEIEKTVERLYSLGYLDDERYARSYIRKYRTSRSARQIQSELLRKGIRLEQPEQLLTEVYEEEGGSEQDALISLIHSRLRACPEPGEKELRRFYAFLQRRGFSYADIRKAMEGFPELQSILIS